MNILILGASGMIGSSILRILSEDSRNNVFGSIRDISWKGYFSPDIQSRLISGVDLMRSDSLLMLFDQVAPDLVINCVGLTKHRLGAEDPLVSVPINALLPHRLARLCKLVGARIIHVSTDCVFSGIKGNYAESDFPDARDVYGKSKILGELDCPNSVTLRTSTIGHELQSTYGLLDWFLSQKVSCKGFAHAIFSGLPTVVFAEVIRDFVIPNGKLSGLYHVAASPINKYELLGLIAKVYQKDIEIIRDDSFRIDRSLNSDRFRMATGYEPPAWPELIQLMHAYR
jgi:dTDP-4-dehydrorhamnose reductase